MEKSIWWVVGILVAGLGMWIVSMFPTLAAATAGSLVTYLATRENNRFTLPTPSFWVAWLGGVVTAAFVSWMDSFVPPIGCLTSAFLGGVAMFVAVFFREKIEASPDEGEGADVITMPPPEERQAIAGPFNGTISSPPPPPVCKLGK